MRGPARRRVSTPVHADLRPNTLSPAPDETDGQDINDPQWYPNADPFAVPDPMEGGSSLESPRRNDGHLDLLHTIAEDVEQWWEQGKDEPRTWPPHASQKPIVIPVQTQAANSWRGDSAQLGAQGLRLAESRDDRVRAVVTNWGPGIVYVAHQSLSDYAGVASAQIPTNAIQIPPPGGGAAGTGVAQNFREFRSKGEIWVYPATGQTPVVDIQDEYGTA
jgi:hypothetical protein